MSLNASTSNVSYSSSLEYCDSSSTMSSMKENKICIFNTWWNIYINEYKILPRKYEILEFSFIWLKLKVQLIFRKELFLLNHLHLLNFHHFLQQIAKLLRLHFFICLICFVTFLLFHQLLSGPYSQYQVSLLFQNLVKVNIHMFFTHTWHPFKWIIAQLYNYLYFTRTWHPFKWIIA